jgi:hypothetical protein
VFEDGTELDPKTGKPVLGTRALPDGEIPSGTPIPALVPMPTLVEAPMPSPVFIQNGQVVYGTPASPDTNGSKVTQNPGYPFFIPGRAGQRAPNPPLDTAVNPAFDPMVKDPVDPRSRPLLDGGLPRHLTETGTVIQWETAYNFSKDVEKLQAVELPEDGTSVEKVAMAFHAAGTHPSTTPEGKPGNFITNGMGPKPGAPFADPCIQNPLSPPNTPDPVTRYKAANIELDVILNKKGWHFPQQRMLTLWGDVVPTLFGNDQKNVAQKAPEPFFFRVNSGACIEYWHTNLIPKYYQLDNFQVRTPTDILGQHIHLVKFDVTASDGAANGFNYEDGTFSPEEVVERVNAINAHGGLIQPSGPPKTLTAVRPFYFCDNPSAAYFAEYCGTTDPKKPGKWVGARTTIQRWWADPLTNGPTPSQGKDRTMRTVFTHDHFGPSTHQQTGLYAALVIEPTDSHWFMPDPASADSEVELGTRQLTAEGVTFRDGGPTSWQASIKTTPAADSFREFLLALQDMQLAYLPISKSKPGPSPEGITSTAGAACGAGTGANNLCQYGWYSPPSTVVNPPPFPNLPGPRPPAPPPQIVSEGFDTGTYSINYRNEPTPFRAWNPKKGAQASGPAGSLSFLYASINREDNCLTKQPVAPDTLSMFADTAPGTNFVKGTVCDKDDQTSPFKYSAPLQPFNNAGVLGVDPYTPLLRAYQNDKVEVRLIAGSHLTTHDFSMPGLKWFFEPSDHNSGYRNNQTIGISEHFELLFTLPPTNGDADYQYLADGNQYGVQNGIWGLLRAYDGKNGQQKQPALPFLPNNPGGSSPAGATGSCPGNAPIHTYTVTAITSDALQVFAGGPNKEMMNVRENIYNKRGMLYLLKEQDGQQVPDFDAILTGKRLPEPLILRANAGDCLKVTVVNQFTIGQPNKQLVFQSPVQALDILGNAPYNIKLPASKEVGLAPQLVSFDVTSDFGGNLGMNSTQTTDPTAGSQKTYTWYAGALFDSETGQYSPHPVEFGATGLFASDPIQQLFQGLEGGLIIEPQGAIVEVDANTRASANVRPGGGASFDAFREFVVLTADNINQLLTINPTSPNPSSVPYNGLSAVNYGVEPWWLRMGLAQGGGSNLEARQFNNIDLSCALSNEMDATSKTLQIGGVTYVVNHSQPSPVVGDMGSPIYTAGAGSKVRFRVLNPGGTNDLVFEIHGHTWQEEPYVNNSNNIGHNLVSEYQGARMGHGPRNHFDAVIESAGGQNAVPGDYLYRSHTALALRSGILGVFRVSEAGKDAITMTAKQPVGMVWGFNTVNPDTGKFADSVDVFAPGTRSGNTCSGTKIANIPLNAGTQVGSGTSGSSMNGAWWVKTTATTVCAVSNFSGGTGGVGTLDLSKPLMPSCTNVMQGIKTHAPTPNEKRADSMTDMLTKKPPYDKTKQ